MKKNYNLINSTGHAVTHENFQEIVLEIIQEVIEERKLIHNRYTQLINKLRNSSRPTGTKTLMGKYLLSRLLRESDRAFNDAQELAKQLCPNCKRSFSNYQNYSEKFH